MSPITSLIMWLGFPGFPRMLLRQGCCESAPECVIWNSRLSVIYRGKMFHFWYFVCVCIMASVIWIIKSGFTGISDPLVTLEIYWIYRDRYTPSFCTHIMEPVTSMWQSDLQVSTFRSFSYGWCRWCLTLTCWRNWMPQLLLPSRSTQEPAPYVSCIDFGGWF